MRELLANKPILGMIHMPALPGAPQHDRTMEELIAFALSEAGKLEAAGLDACIVENVGDVPLFRDHVPPATVAAMAVLVTEVRRATKMKVGVNILRNACAEALSIAEVCRADFIRCNVVIGAYVTDQGVIQGCAAELARLRRSLGSEVLIFGDVHVKHAHPLFDVPIEYAAQDLAERGGVDAVIVSGPRSPIPPTWGAARHGQGRSAAAGTDRQRDRARERQGVLRQVRRRADRRARLQGRRRLGRRDRPGGLCRGRPALPRVASRVAPPVTVGSSHFVTIGNEMSVVAVDSVELANRLRPVLLHLNRYLRREAHAEGITGGQASFLAQIRANPERGVRDLAAREGVSAPAMTRYLDRMEKAGLIVRARSTEDARRLKLALTPKGVRALRSVRRRRTAWLAERLEGLSVSELAAIDRAVEALSRLVEDEA